MPLKRGPIYHDITIDIAMAAAERKSHFKLTTDTPYLALTGELWGVYCEDLGENWPRYSGTALYNHNKRKHVYSAKAWNNHNKTEHMYSP